LRHRGSERSTLWLITEEVSFLAHTARAFEIHQHTRREACREGENARLKKLAGELRLELKKATSARIRRQRSLLVAQRNAGLLQRIKDLKTEHPFWDYRRIWAYLRFVEKHAVNKKRILRLMREHHVVVKPDTRLKAKWMPIGCKPKPTRPKEWWAIAMTKVLVEVLSISV
jgi:putative transposase